MARERLAEEAGGFYADGIPGDAEACEVVAYRFGDVVEADEEEVAAGFQAQRLGGFQNPERDVVVRADEAAPGTCVSQRRQGRFAG